VESGDESVRTQAGMRVGMWVDCGAMTAATARDVDAQMCCV